MASTYTLNNGIELIGTGEQSGTWGDTTNTNLELLDTALDGQVTITAASAGSSGSPNSLPISDGSASNGRNRMVIITSATDLGSDVYYQLTPNDAEKIIYIRNSLNTQDLIVFQGTYNSSNDYVIKNGKSAVIYFDGAGAGAVAANVLSDLQVDALAVDTDTLYVDAANNRVGVNEATPLEALHVTTSDSGTTISKTVGSTSGPVFVLDNTDDTTNNLAAIQFASSGSSSADVIATTGIYSINTGRGGTYSYGDLAFYTTDSGGSHDEAMRIDSSQRVLIGATSSQAVFLSSGNQLQIQGLGSSTSAASITRHSNDGGGPYLNFGKTRGTADGAVTSVADDDVLGQMWFIGADGTDIKTPAAGIFAQVDGTPGSNDMPGRLSFQTTSDGASASTERMRINSSGKVRIGSGDPSYNLDIVGAGNQFIFLQTTDTSDGIYIKADASGNGTEFQTAGGQNKFGFRTNGTLAATIDSSQRVLIGHNSSPTDIWGGQQNRLQVIGNSWSNSGIGLHNYETGGTAANLSFSKSRSGTVGTSGTIVVDGDRLGYMNFAGDDGTDINSTGASIDIQVDGTPGANDMPGRITFRTTADGASAASDRVIIDNAGQVGIGTAASNPSGFDRILQLHGTNSAIMRFTGSTYGVGANDGPYVGMSFGGLEVNNPRSSGYINMSVNGTVGLKIDSNQIVMLGLTTAETTLSGGTPKLQVTGSAFGSYGSFTRRQNTNYGAGVLIAKSRNTSANSYTIVQDNDTLGSLIFIGDDGTDLDTYGAMIVAEVDGTPGANDMPGRLVFSTTADGAASPTERMRITSAGVVDIGSTGGAGSGNVILSMAGGVGTQNGTAAAPTHTFYSDPDTGMYRAGANALGFSTGGSERMQITSSGFVRIGDDTSVSPTSPLMVRDSTDGAIIVANTSASGGQGIGLFTDTSNSRVGIFNNSSSTLDMVFNTGGTATSGEAMRVDNGTKDVMIGTTTDEGASGNFAKIVAGHFTTKNGRTAIASTGVATTLHSFASNAGNFIVSAFASGTGNIEDNTTAIVHINASSTSKITTILAGSRVVLSMSGTNLQVTQSVFAGANIDWSVARIR